MMKKYLILLTLAALFLAGCGTVTISGEAVSAVEATASHTARLDDTSDAVPTTTALPTEATAEGNEPAATAVAADTLLPAPLYYLNPDDNQVWRVEPDGTTLSQITDEAQPVEQYDVNPTDGSLALLTNNSLIVTDALGNERRVIVTAPLERDAGIHWYLTDRISSPVWSADGRQLAYGRNGVNIYDIASDSSRVIMPNDPPPATDGLQSSPIRVYDPRSFSPDGAFLLLMIGHYQSGGGFPATLALNSEMTPVELGGASRPCCTFRWSRDGATIYSANHTFGMMQPGFWRSAADTGVTDVIIPSETGSEAVRVFNWPHDLGEGQVAVFYGEGTRASYEQSGTGPMSIVTVDVAAGEITGSLSEGWMLSEAAWWTDGTAVAVADIRHLSPQNMDWPPRGKLTYLSFSGGSSIELPAVGHTLRWGSSP